MGGRSQGGGGVSVGGGSGSVAGLASEAWVEENYLSKAFFNRLFCVYNANDEVIDPNDPDEEDVIDNIKALVGFWTDDYLSALGLGSGGGGGGITLNEPLASINNLGAPTGTNKVLLWNGSSWGYSSITAGSVTSVALAMPTGFTVTNTPITSTGTLTVNFGGTVTKNYVLASPASADGSPSWRALVSADIPDLSSIYAKVETVYTKTEADAKFMTIAAFENLFNALNSSNQKVSHPYSSSVASIKALVGLWTEQYISALGQSSGGGGGGVTLNQPLSAINSAGLSAPSTNGSVLVYSGGAWKYSSAAGIFATAITVAGTATAAGFSATGKDNTYVLLAGGGTKLLSEIGGGGNYLPLTGGTLTGDLTVNAALGVTGNTTLDGNLYIANNKAIQCKNSSGTIQNVIGLSSSNNLQIGYGSASSGYDSYLSGNVVYLCYGTSRTKGLTLDSSGNVGIGIVNPAYKLDVSGDVRATNFRGTLIGNADTATSATSAGNADTVDNEHADAFVHKTGATMTGTLFMTVGIGIQASNNAGLLVYKPASGWGGVSNTQWCVGALDAQGVIRSNNNDLMHYKSDTAYKIYDASNLTSSVITTALGFTPAASSDLADYLPLSAGGTKALTGTLYANSGIAIKYDTDSSRAYGLTAYNTGGTETANILFHNTGNSSKGVWIINAHSDVSSPWTDAVGKYSLFVGDNKLTYNTYNIYHAGNINTANAGSATKLETARTLWGQSFDGSANVTGSLTNVGTITPTGTADVGTNTNAFRYVYVTNWIGSNSGNYLIIGANNGNHVLISTGGNMGIGTFSPSEKLHVNGNVRIGDAVLVWDSTNGALKVQKSDGTAASFYATGGVSALGNSSSSSSYLDQATADARYLKLSGGQTMTGSFTGTSITLSSQMKSTYAIASSNMTVGTSSLNTSYTLYVNGTGRIGGLVFGNTASVNNVTCDVIATSSSHGIYIKTGTAPNYVDGTWTSASDIRLKDIISNVGASIEQIASAPVFNYRWKAGGTQVMLGTSAQYWRNVFQFGVTEGPNTYLFMDYGATALAAAVITARTVQNHEQRIAALEALSDRQGKEIVSLRAENERLINEINELKAA